MRVERSFAFVDLCGFTRFTDTHGDDAAVDVLTRFRACVRETASEHGVRVAKWLGDGCMFVSTSSPQLVEMILSLTRRADELELTLPLRAGMSSGAVILFEGDDYIGGPVNLAARLCDAAGPHELLASAELAGSVPMWAEYVDVGPRPLQGFVQRIDVLRIQAVALPAHLGR
jgi:class 3 adenylate cyclase